VQALVDLAAASPFTKQKRGPGHQRMHRGRGISHHGSGYCLAVRSAGGLVGCPPRDLRGRPYVGHLLHRLSGGVTWHFICSPPTIRQLAEAPLETRMLLCLVRL